MSDNHVENAKALLEGLRSQRRELIARAAEGVHRTPGVRQSLEQLEEIDAQIAVVQRALDDESKTSAESATDPSAEGTPV